MLWIPGYVNGNITLSTRFGYKLFQNFKAVRISGESQILPLNAEIILHILISTSKTHVFLKELGENTKSDGEVGLHCYPGVTILTWL